LIVPTGGKGVETILVKMTAMKSGSCLLLCAGLALAAAAPAPRLSPPFEIKRVGAEKRLQLSSYRGKPVALIFISTTCPHCQELTTKLVPMAKEYGARVQFLECAINETAEKDLPGFIQQYQTPFPVGFSDQATVNNYLQWSFAQIFYVPHIVLLDAKGVIQGDYAGDSDFITNAAANIHTELDKMLRAQAPAAKKTAARTPATKN